MMSPEIGAAMKANGQEGNQTPLTEYGMPESVLVLVEYYLPGFKAGGPIRSVANLVEALGDEVKFKIVTSDRDIGDRVPYPGVAINEWIRVGKADVMYVSRGMHGFWTLISLLISAGSNDVIYLNSFYSRRFSMLPMLLRRLGFIKSRRTVIAPRGEFSKGALNLKSKRKSLYLSFARWFKVYRNVLFHASSKFEALDIANAVVERRTIQVAGVVPTSEYRGPERRRGSSVIAVAEDIARPKDPPNCVRRRKVCGRLNIVFASRICPMKNLLGALTMLDGVGGEVMFDIYGPTEDRNYWEACRGAIAHLPTNVQVKYHGVVEHHQLASVFAGSDLFFLPTHGENYGHVICEALVAGCPVLISDRTPWRNLQEKHAGWDIPLEDVSRFRAILTECVAGDEARQTALSIGAQNYARHRLTMPETVEANRKLFYSAVIHTSGVAGTRV